MGEWAAVFNRLVLHVRACGWTCPFVVQGWRFVPIGMTSAALVRRPHNDNHKRV